MPIFPTTWQAIIVHQRIATVTPSLLLPAETHTEPLSTVPPQFPKPWVEDGGSPKAAESAGSLLELLTFRVMTPLLLPRSFSRGLTFVHPTILRAPTETSTLTLRLLDLTMRHRPIATLVTTWNFQKPMHFVVVVTG